jgi:hypothetical protein
VTASTGWKEAPAADEDARFEVYAQRFVALQQRNRQDGRVGRALHHKGHGVYEASLTIAADLPEEARHGLFAAPATYEALVRYSNGASKVQADKVADVRGIAVKVLGVAGDKVLAPGTTQDFLAILSSSTPFRTADEFVDLVWATRSPPLALFRLLGSLGLRAFPLVKKLVAGLKQPPASLATKRFYSALPIQCGPYAVRFSLAPTDEAGGEVGNGVDFHTEALADRLRRGPIGYDLALQFFADEATTPIEDASVDWPTPYVKVGRLTIQQQDPASPRGKLLAERGERLSFDPWHALVAHRPLGGMMRARKATYYASTKTREAAPEPASIAALLG